MLKILYAAGNRPGSYFQLQRFISSIKNKNIVYKIAAYKKSMGDINVNYTLDCLLNNACPDGHYNYNGNFSYYLNETKRFAPDLIISDLDIHTSMVALELGIKLWQVSPLLLYFGISTELKYNSKINRNYGHILNNSIMRDELSHHTISNSDRKFIVSHLCDLNKKIQLNQTFEWIRPDFILATHISNDIEFVSASIKHNKNIVNNIKNTNSIIFSEYYYEIYNKLIMKDIFDHKEYERLIGRCGNFITDGSAALTSDAFYNQKPCLFDLQHNNIESIIISHINELLGFGKILDNTVNLNELIYPDIMINDDVKFLHQQLEIL